MPIATLSLLGITAIVTRRWLSYLMCGWSLLFAILHFASAINWTPPTNGSQRIQTDRFAWLLCIGILGVIGGVTALALIQERTHWFPRWFLSASSLSGSALVFVYVLFSFWVDGFHWALAPGVLCVVGAVVALALTQPWGQHLPRWLMLFFAWSGGAVLTLHALYGYVVHGLAAAGILTWTQVQQFAGAPVIPLSAAAIHELIRSSLLLWNPWFLLGGILYLVVAWSASSRDPEREHTVSA
ncbi:MAG: DUF3995 domain-containing protein [Caldilinea sp. CFX5]|nr:DUF3995 domain-containing protein [Caldilinea sp. CFX5]